VGLKEPSEPVLLRLGVGRRFTGSIGVGCLSMGRVGKTPTNQRLPRRKLSPRKRNPRGNVVDSNPFAHCCGVNIIGGYSHREITPEILKKYETGEKARCSHVNTDFVVAHLAIAADYQPDAKTQLEAAGYRELARVKSIEGDCPWLYLMGKGFKET
jgi:hypothetical protein